MIGSDSHFLQMCAQAAEVEVYVAQMPQQDAQACHARNVHNRTFGDVAAAAQALEEPPAAAIRLDCTSLTSAGSQQQPPHGNDFGGNAACDAHAPLHSDSPLGSKRKSEDGMTEPSPAKRAKSKEPDGILNPHHNDDRGSGHEGQKMSDSELLASVDAGLRAHNGGSGGGEAKSRWEADEDDNEGGDKSNATADTAAQNAATVARNGATVGALPCSPTSVIITMYATR